MTLSQELRSYAHAANWPKVNIKYKQILHSLECASKDGKYNIEYAIESTLDGWSILKRLEDDGFKVNYITYTHNLKLKENENPYNISW